eukprot:8462198-Alexandrium_andersonii.AAC.1
MLPYFVVDSSSTHLSQSRLRRLVASQAREEHGNWRLLLSWRVPLWNRPLRSMRDWTLRQGDAFEGWACVEN